MPICWVRLKPCKEWILAWRRCELQKYYFKWRFNHRQGNCNLGNCKFTQKEFWDFNGIQTHSLCVSAAVLYQLSYEDPCIGSRPICWVHLNPWKEWSIGYLNFVNCGNTSYFKWKFDCHAVLYEKFTGTQCLEIQGAQHMRFMEKLTQDFLLAQEQMYLVSGATGHF